MNRAIIGLAIVLVSFAFPLSSGTYGNSVHYNHSSFYSDAKDYDSFEEWSNAHHGISKEQEEEDEKKRQAYLSQKYGDGSSDEEEPKEKPNFVIHDSFISGALKGLVVSVVFLLIKKYRNRK